MKKIFKYTFVGLLAGGMLMTTSCSEDSLITSPTSSMSGEGLLATGNAAQVALNGVYREMYTAGWSTTGNTHQCFGITAYNLASEVMGEDFIMGAMGSGWFWFDCIYDVKDMYTRTTWRNYDLWNAYFSWIANANYIIAAEETMGGSTEDKNYAIGQAYAIRAYSYFMLSQWFARTLVGHENEACVPIYTEPTTPETKGNPRSTNAEVYAQIDADLEKALSMLKGIKPKHKSHLSYPVVLGIKSRVALVENKWAEARDAAHEAIEASGCTVQPVASFIGMNNVGVNNVIWGAEIIPDHVGMYASLYSHMDYESGISYSNTAPKLWNKELYAKMEPTDERRQWVKTGFTYKDQDGVATSGLLQEKFHFSNASTWMGDYIFMRVEEMYLNAAEAECRLGNDAAAQEDLMALMSKRNPDYVCDKTGTALGKTSAVADETGSLLEEIIIQRRIELWGEAGRMYDLKRLKQGFRRTTAQGWCETALLANRPTDNPNNYMWVMTIPQTEFDGNVNMDASKDQNPLGDE